MALDSRRGERPRNSPIFPSTDTMCRAGNARKEVTSCQVTSSHKQRTATPSRRLTVGEESRQVENPASEQGGSHAGGQRFVAHLGGHGGIMGKHRVSSVCVSLCPGSLV